MSNTAGIDMVNQHNFMHIFDRAIIIQITRWNLLESCRTQNPLCNNIKFQLKQNLDVKIMIAPSWEVAAERTR